MTPSIVVSNLMCDYVSFFLQQANSKIVKSSGEGIVPMIVISPIRTCMFVLKYHCDSLYC